MFSTPRNRVDVDVAGWTYVSFSSPWPSKAADEPFLMVSIWDEAIDLASGTQYGVVSFVDWFQI